MILKAIKHLVFVLFLIAFSNINAQNFKEKPVNLTVKKLKIKGSLIIPNHKGKFPLVIFHSGSGPTDRDGNQKSGTNNSIKKLAESLADKKIASFRYDKRLIGESVDSNFSEKDIVLEDFVEDLKAWIHHFAKDKRFSKIIIAGHSEGSLIGILAAINNKEVDGLIPIAGAGRPLPILMKEQMEEQPQVVKKTIFEMLDTLANGDSLHFYPPKLQNLFRPSIQGYLLSLFKYNPKIEIAKLTIPILIIQGTTDIQVTEEDADSLAIGNENTQKLIIENMNHVLKECELMREDDQLRTYNNPNLPIVPKINEGIVNFIQNIK